MLEWFCAWSTYCTRFNPIQLSERSWEWSCIGKKEDYLRLPFSRWHSHVSECPHRQVEGGVGMALPRSLPTARKRQA